MLRKALTEWKIKIKENGLDNVHGSLSSEPVARFLKTYAIFIDHTGKEDKFLDHVEDREILSDEEDQILLKHYESCKKQMGGEIRMKEIIKLIEYLEEREWINP